MIIDDSTTFEEGLIQTTIMEKSDNKLALTYLSRCQSMLKLKCVAEHLFRNCLETFSTYLEVNVLNVEVIMEAELHELKQYRDAFFKGSKGKQLIEFNEYWTLMMKFGIIGKSMTSNDKKNSFWKHFNVLCETVEHNLMVSEQDYGLENHCSRKRTQQTTDKDDSETGPPRKTSPKWMTNSKDQ